MPISEVGHAKNVANFEEVMAKVLSYGVVYKPTNPLLEVPTLTAKFASSDNAMDGVTTKVAQATMEINDRETMFKGLGRIATKSISYYGSTGTEGNNVADARTLNRKLQGTRKSKPVVDDPLTPLDESKNSISASQQSYVQKVEHLDGMIAIYTEDALYAPNETEITLASLNTLSAQLKQATTDVVNAITSRAAARIARNVELYDPVSGLVQRAKLVKLYIKAVFGASSAEYKSINAIKFRTS